MHRGAGSSVPGPSSSSGLPLSVSGSSSSKMSTRGLKRSLAVIQSGIKDSEEEILTDYLCPICMEFLKEAHIITCGHTFCRECLEKTIENNMRCPKCNFTLTNSDNIFPNHLINEQVLKYRQSLELKKTFERNPKNAVISELKNFIEQDSSNLDIVDLNRMIGMLVDKKDNIMSDSHRVKYGLLCQFLTDLKKHKEDQISTLYNEIAIVTSDLAAVTKRYDNLSKDSKTSSMIDLDIGVPSTSLASNNMMESETKYSASQSNNDATNVDGFNVPVSEESSSTGSFISKSKKIKLHFEELSESYFSHRNPILSFEETKLAEPEVDTKLEEFGQCVCKFSQFSRMRPLATLDYPGVKLPVLSNIASSIEFDKDGEYFAVAGLTKKIGIFDYGNVIRDVVDIHYPCAEMVCDAKISCVSWSSYLKSKLASSDYEGCVTIWDAFTTQKLHVYKEHQKRCWSVDFNKMDTKLLTSGSDDSTVKLWHMDSERSLTTLEVKANVCCVQFSPESRYHMAFGSADHCVHYYDLRNLKEAVKLFQGHKKAVSYVKFISGQEIVSASTDSQLKIWNVNDNNCVQSLQGHINEKNFVGLATDGEFVACGSENNSLYVYYKGLPKKILSYRFDQKRFTLENEPQEEDPNDFVSAVCWRKGSNVLVTGNSQGTIKILQMV